MAGIIILSGPIGAGKTTVANELVKKPKGQTSLIEGDKFWSFVANPGPRDRRETFHLIMRSMTAAAVPFARSGFDVIVDVSMPPQFLDTARKIVKELPLHYVVLRPSLAVCVERAATRGEGAIQDYSRYIEFYQLFEAPGLDALADDGASPSAIATRILNGLKRGRFAVAPQADL